MEPIAAAYAYESTLTHDELILIGDFGGGTSDFSLIRVGPTSRTLTRQQRILGNSGLGLAGDAFDARIVRKLVSPALGSESFERSYAQAVRPPRQHHPRRPRLDLPQPRALALPLLPQDPQRSRNPESRPSPR